MDWRSSIERLSPEEVKQMLIGMMDFYSDGIIPEIDGEKYPRLDMFFVDKLQHMQRLENDRLNKLQEYQGVSKSLQEPLGASKRVKEAVNVGVEVPVDVNVDVPVSALSSPTVIDNVNIEVTESQRKEIEFERLFADIG